MHQKLLQWLSMRPGFREFVALNLYAGVSCYVWDTTILKVLDNTQWIMGAWFGGPVPPLHAGEPIVTDRDDARSFLRFLA